MSQSPIKRSIAIDDLKPTNKIWDKFNKNTGIVLSQSQTPLLEIELTKQGAIRKNRRLFLVYEDKIIFYKSKQSLQFKGVLIYDYDLKLEWISKTIDGKVITLGLKFHKNGQTSLLMGFVKEQEKIEKLKNFLNKKLNLMNFHDHFKAEKKIGKGNFANVYLAKNLQSQQNFAIKAFSKEQINKQDKGKLSIINEIDIMRKLNHRNVIRLYEVYETNNSIYMVLEMLNGGNLMEKIKRREFTKEREVSKVLLGLFRALVHIKQQRIMHRDLKPENILFRSNEDLEEAVCIADFGLGSFENVDEYLFMRCGTPGYVAPEVLNVKDKTEKYSTQCDMFSIGIIFHLLLFGKSPFLGKTYNEILSQNRKCSFQFNDPIYNAISQRALDLLKQLLEVNPLKRITAEEALNHDFIEYYEISRPKAQVSKENILKIDKNVIKIDKIIELSDSGNIQNSPVLTKNYPQSPIIELTKFKQSESKVGEQVSLVQRTAIFTGHNKTFENVSGLREEDCMKKCSFLNQMYDNSEAMSPALKISLKNNQKSAFFIQNEKKSGFQLQKVQGDNQGSDQEVLENFEQDEEEKEILQYQQKKLK